MKQTRELKMISDNVIILKKFGCYFVLTCFVLFISLNYGELMTFCIYLVTAKHFSWKKLTLTMRFME